MKNLNKKIVFEILEKLANFRAVALLILLLSISLGLMGCSYLMGGGGGGNGTEDGAVQTSTVDMRNTAYQPNEIEVAVSTTVTWINQDSFGHTVTSESGKFDSGNIGSGEEYSYTFNDAGTFDYSCTIHPSMQGTVVVVKS